MDRQLSSLLMFDLRPERLTAAAISVGDCEVGDVVEPLQIPSPPWGGSTHIVLRVSAPKHVIVNTL